MTKEAVILADGQYVIVEVPYLKTFGDAVSCLSTILRKLKTTFSSYPDSKVLVLRSSSPETPFFGEGQEFFESEEGLLARWEKLVGDLREIKCLLVACLEGACHELGLAVMLACDFRLGGPGANFSGKFSGSGVVPLCSLSFLSLHVGLRLSEQALRSPGSLTLAEMQTAGFLLHRPDQAVWDTLEGLTEELHIPDPQVFLLQRRLVNGCCIVDRVELKGHAAACNALCVQHAASWDQVTTPRPLLSLKDAVQVRVVGRVLEVRLSAHIRDVSSREMQLGLDSTVQNLLASQSEQPNMAVIYIQSVPEGEREVEDILVAGELIGQMSSGKLTPQEQQRAVIQWFLRWERVVDLIQSLPMLTVAVLEGPGSPSSEALQLAVACDLRITQGEGLYTQFPRRNTLPGVMTFQLTKHLVPANATAMLMSRFDTARLQDTGFTQDVKLQDIQGRAGLIPRPLLVAYRSLLDCLWNMPQDELFAQVKKHRETLLASHPAPVSTPPPSADKPSTGVDIKYSQGALFITFQSPVLTLSLLKEVLSETQDIAAKALYFLGCSESCSLQFSDPTCPELLNAWDDLLVHIRDLPIRTVCALHSKINGNALALSQVCSRVVVVEGSLLEVNELAEGRLPAAPLLELVRSLRASRMHRLLILGHSLDAKQISSWGLAHDLVGSLEEAMQVGRISSPEDLAIFKRTKRIHQRVREMPQCDWPKNLSTILEDSLDAGYKPSQSPDASALYLETMGPTSVVVINRANKANAYDGNMLRRLSEIISLLEEHSCRVVIFKSSDPRFFCAGADKERISNPSAKDALHLESQAVFDKLAKASFVSIACVEGAAVGGGFEWALACDIRVAGPKCRLFFPETTLGLIPSAGGCTRLAALVGPARCKQIVMCGDLILTQRALDWGVAQYAPQEMDIVQFAKELGEKISRRPDLATELAKKVIDSQAEGGEKSLLMERVSEAVLYQTKHRPRASIISTGTACPPHKFTQHEVADLLGIHDKKMRGLFVASHILTRHLADIDKEQTGTTQKYLLEKHLKWAKIIGTEAIDLALQRAGISRSDIKFLTVATSTGFLIPALTCHLVECMGLSPHIQRADIVGMGCHAGLNVLQAASNWALANPGQNAVMCCIEICSAEYVWNKEADPGLQMKLAVTNSLFGDGSTAAVVRCDPEPRLGAAPPVLPVGRISINLLGYESYIIPSSLDTLFLEWDDITNKFSFFLTSDVPYAIGEHMPRMINALLERFGLTKKDIVHWVVHSGGKKVLDSMVYSVGITKHDVRHTVSTLADYGNISSGAFLLAFERLQREGTVKRGDFGMFVTMGPGAGMECALWRAGADMAAEVVSA